MSLDVFPPREGVLARVVLWPVAHPWSMLMIAAFCAILSAVSATRLRANGSLAAMFPAHDPSAEALVHVLDDFPAADQLLVLASLPDNAPGPDPQRLTAFGHRFAAAVHQSAEVDRLTEGVYFHPDPDSRRFVTDILGPAAMFYLDDAAFAAARKRLTRDQMNIQLAQDAVALSTPGPAGQALQKMVQTDPLRLHEFIMDRVAGQRPFRTYQNGDDFISPDGRSLLVRVIGNRPPSDLDYSRALTGGAARLAERANTDGLKLQFTGSYPIAARSEQAIRRDMIGSVIGSVVLLQVLFLLAYRRPFMLFALAFGPVALGILAGFGMYSVGSSGLTPLTAVLGAILAGMGIDYSVQYIALYESERAAGSSPRSAAEETATRMSPAVLAAWATSVVGFVAIGFSTVQALRDFAVLGTLGLTGAFLCAVAVLPALLMLTDRRHTPPPLSRIRFGTEPLLRTLGGQRRLWLGLTCAIAIAAVLVIARARGDVLPLETDLTVMHPRPNPAIDAQYDLAARFGISPGSLAVYLRAPDPQRLVTLAYDVNEKLSSPQARAAGVTGTYGLATLLPDPRHVPARLAAASPSEARKVVADFQAALTEQGFQLKPFDGYSNFLRVLLTQRTAPAVKDLLQYRSVAETVLPASASPEREPTEALTLVFLGDALDRDRESRDRAIAAVRESVKGIDGATVTGLTVVAHDAEQTVRHELPRLILAAVLIVAAYLAVHFRNLADATLSLLPAAFGLLIAAAVLRIAGQKLNMINLVAVPLLIGIDVDYGIFLVSLTRFRRVRSEGRDALRRKIEPPVHAVIVCATATILGYVSLAWTSVPAERSLGIAAAVGVGACLAGVLFLLVPLFFSVARGK